MIINYVLIDYENKQPEDLSGLNTEYFRVMVFIGESQKNIPVKLSMALQAMGTRGKYLQISGNGKNALDFHIAFYIGRIATQNPTARFYIIAKDTGYDPLIQHLKEKGISVTRLLEISKIPSLGKTANIKVPEMQLRDVNNKPTVKPAIKKSATEKIEYIIANIQKCDPTKRPGTYKKLLNTIRSIFHNTLSETEPINLIKALVNRKVLTLSDTNKVLYTFPK